MIRLGSWSESALYHKVYEPGSRHLMIGHGDQSSFQAQGAILPLMWNLTEEYHWPQTSSSIPHATRSKQVKARAIPIQSNLVRADKIGLNWNFDGLVH